MDTSEIYIKMCKKAEEIQKLKNPAFPDVGAEYSPFFDEDNDVFSYNTWLPRQDQLQAMLLKDKYKRVENFHSGECALWDNFCYWLDTAFGNECWEYSGEQLWFAFVIKEKSGKVWDGEDWVAVDNSEK